MANPFDQFDPPVAVGPNPFDQFDEKPVSGPNPFDQFDNPKPDFSLNLSNAKPPQSSEELAIQNLEGRRKIFGPTAQEGVASTPGQVWQDANTALYELVPKYSKAAVAKVMSIPAQIGMDQAEMTPDDEQAPVAESLMKTLPSDKAIAIGTGVQHASADLANYFTSPLGIATLGMGSLPVALQRGISAAFAIQMASAIPGAAMELKAELDKPENDRDYQKIAELSTSAFASLGFAALAGKHALTGNAANVGKALGEQVEATGELPVTKTEIQGVSPIVEQGVVQNQFQFSPFNAANQLEFRRQQEGRAAANLPKPESSKNVPETITGSNEGKASEMPAEAGESPVPEQSISAPPALPPAEELSRISPSDFRTWDQSLGKDRQSVRAEIGKREGPEKLSALAKRSDMVVAQRIQESMVEADPAARDVLMQEAINEAARGQFFKEAISESGVKQAQPKAPAKRKQSRSVQFAAPKRVAPPVEPAAPVVPRVETKTPIPDKFETIDDLIKFRNARIDEEIGLYQREIGLSRDQAVKLHEIITSNKGTGKFEKALSPEARERMEWFFEESPWNKKGGPFEFWDTDHKYNPEELRGESDVPYLATSLINAVQGGVEPSATSDRFVYAAIAANRLRDLGATKSDLARALDQYTTRNSGSQGDKLEFFKSTGQKVNSFLRSQGVELSMGDLAGKLKDRGQQPKSLTDTPLAQPKRKPLRSEVNPLAPEGPSLEQRRALVKLGYPGADISAMSARAADYRIRAQQRYVAPKTEEVVKPVEKPVETAPVAEEKAPAVDSQRVTELMDNLDWLKAYALDRKSALEDLPVEGQNAFQNIARILGTDIQKADSFVRKYWDDNLIDLTRGQRQNAEKWVANEISLGRTAPSRSEGNLGNFLDKLASSAVGEDRENPKISYQDLKTILLFGADLGHRSLASNGVLPNIKVETAPWLHMREADGRAARSAEKLAAQFGKRIIWYSGDSSLSHGYAHPELDPGVIFLNAGKAERSAAFLAAHELTHLMASESPQLFKELQSSLISNFKNDDFAKTLLYTGRYPVEHIPEELVAYATQYIFERPDVLERALGGNPSLWQKFVGFVVSSLHYVSTALSYRFQKFAIRPEYNDPKKAANAISKAFADWKKQIESGIPESSDIDPGDLKSAVGLTFKNRSAVDRIVNAEGVSAEGKEATEKFASVQANVRPDTREMIIERAFSKDPQTPEQRVARGYIKKTAELISVSNSPIQVSSIPDPELRKAAAYTKVATHLSLRQEQAKIDAAENGAVKAMAATSKDWIEKTTPLQMRQAMLDAMADSFPKDYANYLKNLSATEPSLANKIALILSGSAIKTGEFPVSSGAVAEAISALADNPNIVTKDVDAAGVVAQLFTKGGKSGVSPADTVVLFGDPTGATAGVDPLLARVKNLPRVIDTLRALKNDQAKASAEIEAFQKQFNPSGRAVSVRNALQRFGNIASQSSIVDTALRVSNRRYEKARAKLIGTQEAKAMSDELLNDPKYKAEVEDAGKALGGIQLDGEYELVGGQFRTKGPFPDAGVDYVIDRIPTREQQLENRKTVETLMEQIDQFVSDPNSDPVKKQTWEIIGRNLSAQWLENISNPMAEKGFIEPFDPKHGLEVGSLNLMPLLQHTHTQKEIFRDYLGGPEVIDVIRAQDSVERVLRGVQRIETNPEYGRKAITNRIFDAATAHGFDVKRNPISAEQYRKEILNPIAASRQHFGQIRLDVGDYIPFTAHKVMPEDVAALKALQRYEREVRNLSEQDLKVYGTPSRIVDIQGGKKFQRESVTTGPEVLTRTFDDSLVELLGGIWKNRVGEISRKENIDALIARINSDPDLFSDFVVGYIRETNPEFKRGPEFDAEFRKLTAEAKAKATPVSTFEDVLDLVAPLRKEPREELEPQLKAYLEREIISYVTALMKQAGPDAVRVPESEIENAVYSSLRTEGSFLKPRGNMLAPSSFYKIAKVADADVTKTPAIAINIARARNLESMKRVLDGYIRLKQGLEQELTTAQRQGGASGKRDRKAKLREINNRAKLGEIRYNWAMLNRRIQQIQSEINKASNNLTKFDEDWNRDVARTMQALNKGIALQLLGAPAAIVNNFFGGTFTNDAILNAFLRNTRHVFASPFIMGKKNLQALVIKSLNGIRRVHPGTADVVNKLMPFSGAIAEAQSKNAEMMQRLSDLGILAPFDYKNKRLAKKNVGFGGEIPLPNNEPSGHLRAIQWAYTTPPGMVQELLFPRAFDNLINTIQAQRHTEILLDVFSRVGDIGDSRTIKGEKLDPTNPNQFITPKELGMNVSQAHWFRTIVEPVGSLEKLMFDYYDRLKQADAGGRPRHEVNVLEKNQMDSILLSFGLLGNVIGETNSPASYRGSWIRRIGGTFGSYPSNMTSQVMKTIPRYGSDKSLTRALTLIALVNVITFGGILIQEGRSSLTQAYTGKLSAQPTLSNILSDPKASDSARYLLGAVTAGLPYLNIVANNLVGSGSTGSPFDLANIVPLAGWARDTGRMINTTIRTGDAFHPLLDYSNRYLPLYAGIVNRLPGASSDLAVRNATRALRAATPSDIEIRQGGGGSQNPTPLTKYLRQIVSREVAGDMVGARRARKAAIDWKVKNRGITPDQAAKEVDSSIRSRNPESMLYGRHLTDTERERVRSRMTPAQLSALNRVESAVARLTPHKGRQGALASFRSRIATRPKKARSAQFRRSLAEMY